MTEDEQSPTGCPNHSKSIVLMTMLEHDFIDFERRIGTGSIVRRLIILLVFTNTLIAKLQILLSIACLLLHGFIS